jgi:hypothetical protein
MLREPDCRLALEELVHAYGKKLVDCKTYDNPTPPVPPKDGWYYPVHDRDGTLICWLHADQVAGDISPDYPPVSRDASNVLPDSPAPDVVLGSPDPAQHQDADAPAEPKNANSSTSPPPADSTQTPSIVPLTPTFPQPDILSPNITSVFSPGTTILTPPAVQALHLHSQCRLLRGQSNYFNDA